MPKINHKFILHTTFHHHTKSSILFSAEEVLTLNSMPFKTKRKNFLYSNEETVYLVLITYQKQFLTHNKMQQSNTNFTPPRLLLIHPSVLPFGILFLKNAYKKFACKKCSFSCDSRCFSTLLLLWFFILRWWWKWWWWWCLCWIADQQKCVGIISSRFITAGSHDRISQHTADLNLCKTKVLTCLTYFSPKSHFVRKPVISFILQIKWLVSVWNATLGWNGSKRAEKKS